VVKARSRIIRVHGPFGPGTGRTFGHGMVSTVPNWSKNWQKYSLVFRTWMVQYLAFGLFLDHDPLVDYWPGFEPEKPTFGLPLAYLQTRKAILDHGPKADLWPPIGLPPDQKSRLLGVFF
jgi:hypothetical protein